MNERPLDGRRIVVTRAADQAGPLGQLLRSAGAEVIELPMIGVEAPADGGSELAVLVAAIDQYDWLVVTSPNGARAVCQAAPKKSEVPEVRIAAVGRATATAIGWPVELVPERQDAASLAAVFPPGTGRLLLVQGDLAPPDLGDRLEQLGWKVDRVVGYRTRSIAPDPGMVEAVLSADVVTFASGSAVRSFVEHLGVRSLPPIVVTLGNSTRTVAQELGVAVTASAKSNTLADLGLAVVAACRRASSGTIEDASTPDPA